MKAIGLSLLLGTLCFTIAPACAAPSAPARAESHALATPPAQPTDGVRSEDVMFDDDAIGDVWDTLSPADAMGITDKDANILSSIVGGKTSAELLQEQALLEPPRPAVKEADRIPTERWHPHIPIQTLFYLMLAVVIVVVLLLKARG